MTLGKILFIVITLIIFIPFFIFEGFFVHKKCNKTIKMSQGPFHGIGIYIINLEKSQSRYQYILSQAQLLGLPITRINAIDGSNLTDDDIHRNVDLTRYKNFLGYYPKKGTIGCSLSHFKAWQAFLTSNYKFALILEDDVGFDSKELQQALETITKHERLWDICSFDIIHNRFPLIIKQFSNINKKLSIYPVRIANAGSYIINRDAAFKLLEKAYPIKIPVDHYFNRSWEFNIKFTAIEPKIVLQNYGDSEIFTTTQLQISDISIKNKLAKLVYLVKSSIMTFLYNIKLYINSKIF